MRCTQCGDVVRFDDEDITIHAVYGDGRIRRVCHHVTDFDRDDPGIIATLGSIECYNRWCLERQPARSSPSEDTGVS